MRGTVNGSRATYGSGAGGTFGGGHFCCISKSHVRVMKVLSRCYIRILLKLQIYVNSILVE